MGAGNVCIFGDYEGLYYINHDNFSGEYEDFEGNLFTDYDMAYEELVVAIEDFAYDMNERFNSFIRVNKFDPNIGDIVLENGLFYIAYEDNGWSTAIKLIQKDQNCGRGNLENLQASHYQTYLDGIRDCLFLRFEELGTYSGPWTSGRINREMYGIKKRFHI